MNWFFESQQHKAKNFRKFCCNVMFQQIRQQLSNKINKSHCKAIKEKDVALALFNDDLKSCEHENVALQAQRDVYKKQLQKCQGTITHF